MGPPRDKSRFNEHLDRDDAYRRLMQSPPPPIPDSLTPNPLKRAGAVRRLPAPNPVASDLTRPATTFEEIMDAANSSDANPAGQEKSKGRSKSITRDKGNPQGNVSGMNSDESTSPLPSSETSLTSDDWFDPDQVCTVKRSGAVRTKLNTLITRLEEKLWINADEFAQKPHSEQPAPPTRIDDQSNEKSYREKSWKEYLVWNLESIRELMKLLKIWTLSGVPASDMGCFLECVLYQRDEHMGDTVTKMIDANKTYAEIAQFVMRHYQIRDDDQNPLWTNLDPGQPSLRPKDRKRELNERRNRRELLRRKNALLIAQEQNKSAESSSVAKDGPWYHIPAPQPVRPISWPFFMGDLDHGNDEGQEESDEEVSRRRCFDEKIVLGNAVKKPVVQNTRPIPQGKSAELVDGEQTFSDPIEVPRKIDTSKPLPPLADTAQTNSRPQHPSSHNADTTPESTGPFHKHKKPVVNGTSTHSDNVVTDSSQANHSQPHSSASNQPHPAGCPATDEVGSQPSPLRHRCLRSPIPASVLLEHILNATHKELGISFL